MKKSIYLLILSFTLLLFAACNEDESPSGETTDNQGTIADYISENPDFTLLQEAVELVGLEISLDGTTPYTLFAPTNIAFESYLSTREYETMAEVPLDSLTNLLLFHLLDEEKPSTALSGFFNSLATTKEYPLSSYASGNNPLMINFLSTVQEADIATSNGFVHTVDSVISMPKLKDFIVGVTQFSGLENALRVASDETFDYIEFFNREKTNLTLIAPSNEAFEALPGLFGVSTLEEIPLNSLRRILNYHILSGVNLQTTDFEDGQELNTNDSEDITASIAQNISFVDAIGISSEIVLPNIQASNGVVHQIDNVMLSGFIFDQVNPTITGLVEMNGALSLLEIALELTGLDVVLDNRTTNYTLLAPNNTAFSVYLQGEDIDDIPLEDLTQLLLNHTFTTSIASTEFETGYATTSAFYEYENTTSNLHIYVDTEEGVKFNDVSSVLEADQAAANGIVHIVDRVIELPTITTFVTADPNFNLLETAITQEGQPDYPSILSATNGVAPYTLFAPNDSAFEDLLVELSITDISEIDTATLTAAINTHVITDSALRAEDLITEIYSTLGDDIAVDAENATITDGNGRVSTLVSTNLQTVNGVIHTIDTVLLPL